MRDFCKGEGCGRLLPIVNKKYYLCDECNFKRLHNGSSKEDVYRERALRREGGKEVVNKGLRDGRNLGHNKKPGLDEQSLQKLGITKGSKIASVSSAKRYRCSNGELVSQTEIKWRLQLAHDKIKETRLPICEGLGRSGLPLSFSHTISVARCKDLGKTELIWDENNIFLESFHEPSSKPVYAHNIWETGTIEQKITLLNFLKKMEYIEIHDPETYNKYLIKIDELNEKLLRSGNTE